MTAIPQGRFFNQNTDDTEHDYPYLEPLNGIPGLPPVSGEYTEYARALEAIESGTPLAETRSGSAVSP